MKQEIGKADLEKIAPELQVNEFDSSSDEDKEYNNFTLKNYRKHKTWLKNWNYCCWIQPKKEITKLLITISNNYISLKYQQVNKI